MFFILSKVLVILIYPLTWIIIAIAGAIFLKNNKLKRKCLLTAFSLFLIFSNPFLLNQFAHFWDITTTPDHKNYSAAIVLGGYASEDEHGNGYFNTSADRFIQGTKLKTSGKVKYLLFTGGSANILLPKGFRESRWTAEQLKEFHIDSTAVLTENESRNTYENALFSKQLLESKKIAPPYLLVTSAFHMRRSLMTFEKAGVKVVPYSCNYIAGHERISLDNFIPDAGTLDKWNKYIKELIGYIVYAVKS